MININKLPRFHSEVQHCPLSVHEGVQQREGKGSPLSFLGPVQALPPLSASPPVQEIGVVLG